ncbi:hypothetical protein TSUD_320330 [Trifolium subterraneum]|uniref:Uncharacterized protein n=1 Tax=Trifolium subterraneum TaxID=3900 RepID=A0A2Z6NHZ4_TRISU|nr:hypothetical protein TSUD_320330 [Trifolium subterraneum]
MPQRPLQKEEKQDHLVIGEEGRKPAHQEYERDAYGNLILPHVGQELMPHVGLGLGLGLVLVMIKSVIRAHNFRVLGELRKISNKLFP